MLPEEARTALIKLVEDSGRRDFLMGLSILKTGNIEYQGNNKISIGRWMCDLDQHTFVISIVAGDIFSEYSGIFKWEYGKWYAVIEREAHN